MQVISGEDHLKEAALKEVLCRSQSELQQALQWSRWALGLAPETWTPKILCYIIYDSYLLDLIRSIFMIFSNVHDIKMPQMPIWRCVCEAIFEVQVLLALERAAAPHGVELRVPRCISYKVHWRTLENSGGLV